VCYHGGWNESTALLLLCFRTRVIIISRASSIHAFWAKHFPFRSDLVLSFSTCLDGVQIFVFLCSFWSFGELEKLTFLCFSSETPLNSLLSEFRPWFLLQCFLMLIARVSTYYTFRANLSPFSGLGRASLGAQIFVFLQFFGDSTSSKTNILCVFSIITEGTDRYADRMGACTAVRNARLLAMELPRPMMMMMMMQLLGVRRRRE
jgi:hypothetical protein